MSSHCLHTTAAECDCYHQPAVADARYGLVVTLRELRYSGSVWRTLPDMIDAEQSETDFLDSVIPWIAELGKVLATVSDTNTEMAAELVELRGQRKAVRDFLGIGEQ